MCEKAVKRLLKYAVRSKNVCRDDEITKNLSSYYRPLTPGPTSAPPEYNEKCHSCSVTIGLLSQYPYRKILHETLNVNLHTVTTKERTAHNKGIPNNYDSQNRNFRQSLCWKPCGNAVCKICSTVYCVYLMAYEKPLTNWSRTAQ